jgi:hypothetical protein
LDAPQGAKVASDALPQARAAIDFVYGCRFLVESTFLQLSEIA